MVQGRSYMVTDTQQLRRACAKALEYSSKIRWTDERGPHMSMTRDFDLAIALKKIEDIVSRVTRDSAPPVVVEEGKNVASPLGHRLLQVVKECPYDLLVDYFPHHTLHPLIGLFWRHTRLLPQKRISGRNASLDELVDCVKRMRAEASTAAFRSKRDLHVKLVKDNTRSLLTYIEGLFSRWSKLLVVRVDLSYSAKVTQCWPAEGTVTLEQAIAHRKKMLAYLRGAFPATLRGYAWSLEHAPSKSFHYHVLLFFDGQTSREGISLARAVGEHWKTVVTENFGLYYNCNAHAHLYPREGLGLIHHSDGTKVGILKEEVATYLTKGNYLSRFAIPNGRTFSHGLLPDEVRRGRPRTRGIAGPDEP